MKNKISIILIIIAFFIASHSISYAEGDMIGKIKDSYASIKDIKGLFEQTNNIGGKSKTFEAAFYIKIPKKMSWRYEGVGAQEVYINNSNIVFYQPKYKQAYVSTYNQSTSGLKELTLLEGFSDVEKNYIIKEMDGFVRLTPSTSDSKVNYIEVYPSNGKFPVEKIVISGKDENNITIKIKTASINSGIADSLFVFDPPNGTTLLDQ
ncbi:MAG: outer membrane lipoprotein carrier protein LolA [Nitrospirae bacterium]|nr:outer membrane lipoprotein carrier protein LolA [Nitrospirota bacterium]MBF0539974.1 outer membrane lipoprotein carrier protein LolA [Nitrospirota bacterium]